MPRQAADGQSQDTTFVIHARPRQPVAQCRLAGRYTVFQLAGDAGSIKLLDTITFEVSGAGTAVTYHAEFTPEGAAKLAEPLMPAGLKVLADKVAASMEEKLAQL